MESKLRLGPIVHPTRTDPTGDDADLPTRSSFLPSAKAILSKFSFYERRCRRLRIPRWRNHVSSTLWRQVGQVTASRRYRSQIVGGVPWLPHFSKICARIFREHWHLRVQYPSPFGPASRELFGGKSFFRSREATRRRRFAHGAVLSALGDRDRDRVFRSRPACRSISDLP